MTIENAGLCRCAACDLPLGPASRPPSAAVIAHVRECTSHPLVQEIVRLIAEKEAADRALANVTEVAKADRAALAAAEAKLAEVVKFADSDTQVRLERGLRQATEAERDEALAELDETQALYERAEARAEALAKALEGLVHRLDEIHDSGVYQAVWTLNQIHNGPYAGPTYVEALNAARAALARAAAPQEEKRTVMKCSHSPPCPLPDARYGEGYCVARSLYSARAARLEEALLSTATRINGDPCWCSAADQRRTGVAVGHEVFCEGLRAAFTAGKAAEGSPPRVHVTPGPHQIREDVPFWVPEAVSTIEGDSRPPSYQQRGKVSGCITGSIHDAMTFGTRSECRAWIAANPGCPVGFEAREHLVLAPGVAALAAGKGEPQR